MTSFIVNIKKTNKLQLAIYIPHHLLKKFEIKPKETISLSFGSNKVPFVKVIPIKSEKDEFYLTSTLADEILLPYSKRMMVQKSNDGLKIGPLVGILTTDYTGGKFSSITKNSNAFNIFFKDILSPEPQYPAYYFVFTPDNADWSTRTIKGYFIVNGIWKTITVPFPDVVYNRVPNRTIEKSSYIEHFKQQYMETGQKLFNYDFFNKWDIYQLLVKNEDTKKYIPETYLNPSLEKLKEMLRKYPLVYLKPANGSLGLGIFKILRTTKGYLVQFRKNQKNTSLFYKDIPSLYRFIFERKFRNRYVIQQGIQLIEYQQSPVDFRVQVHKNNLNNWELIAIGAKVAGKGSVTTHLRTGGKLINANNYLNSLFGSTTTKILKKIEGASINIAQRIEEKKGLDLGELGLDIGIDKNGGIWLFEVNSKPGRSIFKHPSLKKAREEANKKLLEYSIYLSGFTKKVDK